MVEVLVWCFVLMAAAFTCVAGGRRVVAMIFDLAGRSTDSRDSPAVISVVEFVHVASFLAGKLEEKTQPNPKKTAHPDPNKQGKVHHDHGRHIHIY